MGPWSIVGIMGFFVTIFAPKNDRRCPFSENSLCWESKRCYGFYVSYQFEAVLIRLKNLEIKNEIETHEKFVIFVWSHHVWALFMNTINKSLSMKQDSYKKERYGIGIKFFASLPGKLKVHWRGFV